MRNIISVILLVMLLILTGCSNSEFDPVVVQNKKVLELDEEVNPIDLISDAENAGLAFVVTNSNLDVHTPGEYSITYTISRNRKSVEKTFTFVVKDNDGPIITCQDSIDILYGGTFNLADYASAYDDRDGDVSNTLHYSGSINAYKEGKYTITILANDQFDNESSLEVVVNVKKDNKETYKKSICGTYINKTMGEEKSMTLSLFEDNTYSIKVTVGEFTTTVDGTYMQYEDVLYLTSEEFQYSYTPEQNLIRFVVDIDGTLMFDSQISLISAPTFGDIYAK